MARNSTGNLLKFIVRVGKVLNICELRGMGAEHDFAKNTWSCWCEHTASGLALRTSLSLSPGWKCLSLSGSKNLYRPDAVPVMEDGLQGGVGDSLHAFWLVVFLRRVGRPSSLPSLLSPCHLPRIAFQAPASWPNAPTNAIHQITWSRQ